MTHPAKCSLNTPVDVVWGVPITHHHSQSGVEIELSLRFVTESPETPANVELNMLDTCEKFTNVNSQTVCTWANVTDTTKKTDQNLNWKLTSGAIIWSNTTFN